MILFRKAMLYAICVTVLAATLSAQDAGIATSDREAAANESDTAATTRPLAVYFLPGSTLTAGINGYLQLPFQAQYAFTPYFGAASTIDLTTAADYVALGIYLGPQVNFMGHDLDGLVLNIQPGVMLYPLSASGVVFAFRADLGYQLVTAIGLSFGLFGAVAIANDVRIDFGVKIGYAFSVSRQPDGNGTAQE